MKKTISLLIVLITLITILISCAEKNKDEKPKNIQYICITLDDGSVISKPIESEYVGYTLEDGTEVCVSRELTKNGK